MDLLYNMVGSDPRKVHSMSSLYGFFLCMDAMDSIDSMYSIDSVYSRDSVCVCGFCGLYV